MGSLPLMFKKNDRLISGVDLLQAWNQLCQVDPTPLVMPPCFATNSAAMKLRHNHYEIEPFS